MSVINVTKENFDDIVLNSGKTVLLDFFATWCGPCRMLSPTVDKIAEELEGDESKIIGKINVDEQPELAQKFSVMSIPTLVVVRDRKIANKSVGVKTKQQILDMLD